MTGSPYAAFPALPPGVAEWEDLLLRFELGPRIAKTVLDEIPGEQWDQPVGTDPRSPCDHLAHLAACEDDLQVWIGASHPVSSVLPPERDARAHLERFSRLRDRNFAALQRRGVEVWEWTAAHPRWGETTVFQLLSVAVRHDGRHISRMRAAC